MEPVVFNVTHRLAVKAIILDENKRLLILKRSSSDRHMPGIWGLPGGKLNPSEDPYKGLIRETKEETNLDISVSNPIRVHFFEHTDGGMVTLITFLCETSSKNVELNHEHSEFKWSNLDEARGILHKAYHKDLSLLETNFL